MSIEEVLVSKLNAIVHGTVKVSRRHMLICDVMDLVETQGLPEDYLDGRAPLDLVWQYRALWVESEEDRVAMGSRV